MKISHAHVFLTPFRRPMRAIGTFLLLMGAACTNQHVSAQTSFHPLPDLEFVQTAEDYDGNRYDVRNDFVVVANPPAQRDKLKALIDAYNARTLSSKLLAQHFGHIRRFYRESASMPRDYKESDQGYFDKDRWEHHGDDLLVIVKWKEFGKEVSHEFP